MLHLALSVLFLGLLAFAIAVMVRTLRESMGRMSQILDGARPAPQAEIRTLRVVRTPVKSCAVSPAASLRAAA